MIRDFQSQFVSSLCAGYWHRRQESQVDPEAFWRRDDNLLHTLIHMLSSHAPFIYSVCQLYTLHTCYWLWQSLAASSVTMESWMTISDLCHIEIPAYIWDKSSESDWLPVWPARDGPHLSMCLDLDVCGLPSRRTQLLSQLLNTSVGICQLHEYSNSGLDISFLEFVILQRPASS